MKSNSFKALIGIIIILLLIPLTLAGCAEDLPYVGPDAVLLFEDNFDSLDTTKWKINPIEDNIRRACYYHSDNVFIDNGNLVLRIDYQPDGEYGTGWYAGWVETSASLGNEEEGYNGFSYTYGYMEVRCRAEWIEGAWSAIWLMPDNNVTFGESDIQGTAEDGAEIDIMETNSPKNFNAHAIHYDGYDSRLKSVNSGIKYVNDMDSEYHIYGFEWTEEGYTFYIDGRKTWQTNEMGVSAVAEYIILSNEVGGYYDENGLYPGVNSDGSEFWFGNVDTESNRASSYDMIIDYVRVYDRKG